MSYTRTTLPDRVSAIPGKEMTAAAPGVRDLASSREKGTVSFRFMLSTTWATGVPEEIMSPTWTLTAVTVPEAWATTDRSAQAAWAWLREAWALSRDSWACSIWSSRELESMVYSTWPSVTVSPSAKVQDSTVPLTVGTMV